MSRPFAWICLIGSLLILICSLMLWFSDGTEASASDATANPAAPPAGSGRSPSQTPSRHLKLSAGERHVAELAQTLRSEKADGPLSPEALKPLVEQTAPAKPAPTRVAALLAVGSLKTKNRLSLKAAVTAMEDPDPRIRRAGADALRMMTGLSFPDYRSASTAAERQRAMAVVRRWLNRTD